MRSRGKQPHKCWHVCACIVVRIRTAEATTFVAVSLRCSELGGVAASSDFAGIVVVVVNKELRYHCSGSFRGSLARAYISCIDVAYADAVER
jgi:hypothetical protein